MANSNISNYIRQQVAKGISLEKIRTELAEAGWSPKDVSEAIAPYSDQKVSASPEAAAENIKDIQLKFSSSLTDPGFTPDENSPVAEFKIAEISDAKEYKEEKPKKHEEKKKVSGGKKGGFRVMNVVLPLLIILISGSVFFVIRGVSSALNAGGERYLTLPSPGATVIQKIRNQNQQTTSQSGSGSSTAVLYPAQFTVPTPTPFTGDTPITQTPPPTNSTPGTSLNNPPPQNNTPVNPPPTNTGIPLKPAPTSSVVVKPPTQSQTTPAVATPLPIPIFPPTQFAPAEALRIISLTVPTITYASATIVWASNHLVFFKFEYGKNNSYGLSYPINSTPVTMAAIKIQNLAPLTTYHYRLKLVDGFGASIFSPDQTFTTKDVPPPTPPPTDVEPPTTTSTDVGQQPGTDLEPTSTTTSSSVDQDAQNQLQFLQTQLQLLLQSLQG